MPERVKSWPEIYDTLQADRHNPQAWTEITARVRYWAGQQLRGFSEGIIEEGVQDTCARVFVGFDKARGRSTFAGFVFSCLKSTRRDIIAHKPPPTTSVEDVETILTAPEPAGLEPDEVAAIRACLAGLPEDDRALVTLCRVEGYKPNELTRRFGKNANALRVQLHRALEKLRDCVSKKHSP